MYRAEIKSRRSIPACAGEPTTPSGRQRRRAVYPRVCGGTGGAQGRCECRYGLSPRVRGNRTTPDRFALQVRSIPACAGEPRSSSMAVRTHEVYPRVCGGTLPSGGHAHVRQGLSPRVRGNLLGPRNQVAHHGSIPACAGEPLSGRDVRGNSTVYPRVCGGTLGTVPPPCKGTGLSPRVRGNPLRRDRPHVAERSIPACAGEPLSYLFVVVAGEVYPRVCGGTRVFASRTYESQGLSPRVRGNLALVLDVPRRSRSIPACAGEPNHTGGARCATPVYPRVCGGTSRSTVNHSICGGLSPRVRGNLPFTLLTSECLRSIPACAGEPAEGAVSVYRGRVYPRVCGGTSLRQASKRRDTGLSPRVRGNHLSFHLNLPSVGSIPACAGEPRTASPPARRRWVYPRVCGGTFGDKSQHCAGYGLSPRVRGNPLEQAPDLHIGRSIPACAGEPPPGAPTFASASVYPRVCGGTPSTVASPPPAAGLSPRVRGNPPAPEATKPHHGSIPACAGEPRRAGRRRLDDRVYPRVCGGTVRVPYGSVVTTGLSPRVRGNRPLLRRDDGRDGSIPACAGEPSRASCRPIPPWVYPRVCGGTSILNVVNLQVDGLSPRVRGNQHEARWGRTTNRSIPACAGEPFARPVVTVFSPVYPRVCGGTSVPSFSSTSTPGLSPRVRGNLAEAHRGAGSPRSIPACAGEPCGRAAGRGVRLVYPRVCGGTAVERACRHGCKGLSPRVRGNPPYMLSTLIPKGSIPACAGEPRSTRDGGCTTRVYPRVCGGTSC